MIFTQLRFLLFFAVCFCVHWALRSQRGRKIWLLLCSYGFYAGWDYRFLSLIVGSTLVDHFAGRGIHASEDPGVRKRWLMLSLAANIGVLATFKYLGFFVESTAELLQALKFQVSVPALEIVLPVGISFYTFQTLSYSLDIYFRRLKPTETLLDLSLFVAFFPQLVAGPIVRASDFLPQLTTPRRFANVAVRPAVVLFLVGFFKKAVVSDNLSPIADAFFKAPDKFDAFGAWGAMLMFSIQLYCDFSGYTDMAIATAALLGYQLCSNFQFPYFAPNLRHFWRRWHISLSSWFNDYVYIPLGGSRGSKWFAYRNTFISMLLAGLWHGARWNFVLWGAYHGLALIIYQEISQRRPAKETSSLVWTMLSTAFTFWVVCFSMVFFRASDMQNFSVAVQSLFLNTGSGQRNFGTNPHWAFAALALAHYIAYRGWLKPVWKRSPNWLFAVGSGLAASGILAFMNGEVQPFIYFQF